MAKSKSSKGWLKEHFDDEFVKRSQEEGVRSRAVYKLEEIDLKDKLLKSGVTLVDLGAAPGGWSEYASMLVRSARSGGNSSIDWFDKSNQQGEVSVRIAQVQCPPRFLVEACLPWPVNSTLLGIGNIGSLGLLRKHSSRFASSLNRMQQLSRSFGISDTAIAFDSSSPLRDIHPLSVKRNCAPLLPAGKSLETRPSSLILRISADA